MERRKLIGKRIELARVLKGMSRVQLAKAIGVSDVSIGRWERGTQPIRLEHLYELARVLGQNIHDFLHDEPATLRDLVLRAAPVTTQVGSAGPGAPSEEYAYIPAAVAPQADIFGLEVVGECLLPEINPGDTLIVDRNLSPRDGDLVVAVVEGSCMVKRFRDSGGRSWLESNDEKFSLESATIQGTVIGKSQSMRRK